MRKQKGLVLSCLHPIKTAKNTQHVKNDGFRRGPFPNLKNNLNATVIAVVQTTTNDWADCTPTPLVSVKAMAAASGLYTVDYKNVSRRFGLKSFNALGGA